MGTDLVLVERELTTRLPTFLEVLPPSVTPQRLMRTVLMSCQKTPKLLECSMQSIINAATTAAVLGLECDGVTGQGYLIPFAGVATFMPGYKGYNSLAARAGYTINGGVVREGDDFDFMEGTGGYVKHKKRLDNPASRRIIATWATGESRGRPNIVAVLPIEEVMAIKAKSPGARKPDSPWNDVVKADGTGGIGFAAMVEKTGKRRLARSMPLSVMQYAAALEDQYDLGNAAYLTPDRELKIVGASTIAAGPVENGVVSPNAQPDDLMAPANKAAVQIKFPTFANIKDFDAYSWKFLETATPEQARAWEAHYHDKLEGFKAHANPGVRTVYAEIMVEYKKAIGE